MEVLLYGSIYSQSAIDFITAVNTVDDGELTVRVNCDGGEVAYGWGMITKIKEFEGKKTTKVDGQAHSMSAFALLYTDDTEAVDVAQFCIHRAAYNSWYESDWMTDPERIGLVNMNKSLETAFRNKIDIEKFEKIAGFTVSEMFSMDDRKEVYLTASQAKQVGLIKRVIKITPEKQNEVNAHVQRVAAQHTGITEFKVAKIVAESQIPNPINNNSMNLEELIAQHPALYAQILAMGVKQGTEAERDRVGAWAAFLSIDAKAAQEGIESGNAITQTAVAQFQVKAMTSGALNTLKIEGAQGPDAGAEKPEGTEIEKAQAAAETAKAEFAAKMNAGAGVVKPENTVK